MRRGGRAAARSPRASSTLARTRSGRRRPSVGCRRLLGLLARDRELERLADDGLQLGELAAHRAQVGAQRRQAAADEVDEHLEILDARHALGEQVALDARRRQPRAGPSGRATWSMRRPRPPSSSPERARDGGLDARRQDRGELARRAPQLVHVPLGAREQRAQVGTRRLARADASLAQFADAAQGRLARVAQWIVLRVFGVHRAPLVAARSVDDRGFTGTTVRAHEYLAFRARPRRAAAVRPPALRAQPRAAACAGLLGAARCPTGEGLAFREKSIHMFFMRMSLDIVFCDAEHAVVRDRPRALARGGWPAAGARATSSRSGRARLRGSGCARAWRCASSPRSSGASPAERRRDCDQSVTKVCQVALIVLLDVHVRAYGGAGCTERSEGEIEMRRTVLLVEDEARLADVLAEQLAEEGFDVRQARSLRQALRLLDDLVPDVAVVDIGLPGRIGARRPAAAALRRRPARQRHAGAPAHGAHGGGRRAARLRARRRRLPAQAVRPSRAHRPGARAARARSPRARRHPRRRAAARAGGAPRELGRSRAAALGTRVRPPARACARSRVRCARRPTSCARSGGCRRRCARAPSTPTRAGCGASSSRPAPRPIRS